MNFSMVLVAKASMLQLNVNARGQRKVYDDVQKPASNSHTVENALHPLQRYAIGYLDSPIFPKLQATVFPLPIRSLENLS